jgi:ribosomal protein S9
MNLTSFKEELRRLRFSLRMLISVSSSNTNCDVFVVVRGGGSMGAVAMEKG